MVDVEYIRNNLDLRNVAEFYGMNIRRGMCSCPFHAERTASCHVTERHFKCFGCGAGGDVITFVRKLFDLSFVDAVTKLDADFSLGLNLGERQSAHDVLMMKRAAAERALQRRREEEARRANAPDHTAYYKACRERLTDPRAQAYLSKRGISLETAKRFWLGFDANADPAQGGHKTPRIIIPVSKSFYIGRSTDPSTPKQFAKLNSKGSSPDLFNKKTLWESGKPIFIVEGAFDALAVEEAGGRAISLNSASNTALLLKLVTGRRPLAPLIISLDTDATGQERAAMLARGLAQIGVRFSLRDISCGEKDPSDGLVRHREEFIRKIRKTGEAVA